MGKFNKVCWRKTNKTIEPRIEVTKVGKKYEIYREPQGDIGTFSSKDLKDLGINEKQIKGTTYFVRGKS